MCFHKWGKWEPYVNKYHERESGNKEIVAIEKRQRRFCYKCNKEQDRIVSWQGWT